MRSHLDTTKLRWEIGRRLLRTISHKERPSISVAVYKTDSNCKMSDGLSPATY